MKKQKRKMSAFEKKRLRNVVFIRHGESEGNVAHKDISLRTEAFDAEDSFHYRLTDSGRKQAKKTGKWLKTHFANGFDTYICSPYARTQETAALLDLPNTNWLLNSGLEEANDHTHDNFEDATDDPLFEIKEESFKLQNYRRFIKGMQHVETFITQYIHQNITNSESIVIVCHANVLRYIQFRLDFLSVEELKEKNIVVRNCEVFWYTKNNQINLLEALPPLYWYKTTYCHQSDRKKAHVMVWSLIKPKLFTNDDLLKRVEKTSPCSLKIKKEMKC